MLMICDTCGEDITDLDAVAEVVRDGKHVLVHAENGCFRPDEEIA